jgi:hypothetical protein
VGHKLVTMRMVFVMGLGAIALGCWALLVNVRGRITAAAVRTTVPIFGLGAIALGCFALWVDAGGHITAVVLSPIASFAAAGIALWVATRDRRDRIRERADAGMAQARLVLIDAAPTTEDRLRINVDNYGREPIIDVDFVSARIRTKAKDGNFLSGIRALKRIEVVPRRESRSTAVFRARTGPSTISKTRTA